MARARIELQPSLSVSAATTQEPRYASKTGGAMSGVAFVNVFSNSSTSSTTVTLYTATANDLDPTTGTFWKSVGSVAIGAGSTGAFTIEISERTLADFLRWGISGLNNTVSFAIVAYLYDT